MAAGNKAQTYVAQWALQHQMIPEQLDVVAEAVRDAYVEARRSTFSNYRQNTTKYNITFWRHVATKVLDCNADPIRYVALAFRQFGSNAFPEALLSGMLTQTYGAPVRDEWTEHRIELSIHLYATKLKQRYAEGRCSLEQLLIDIEVCGCPLFTWCVATKHGLHHVAARYAKRAERMLLDPAYYSVYTRVFKEIFDGRN